MACRQLLRSWETAVVLNNTCSELNSSGVEAAETGESDAREQGGSAVREMGQSAWLSTS